MIVADGAPRHGASADPRRRARLAAIHVGRKALGMAEDDYRALLERVTGQRSAGACDDRQLGAIITELDRLGFKPTSGLARSSRRPADHPIARKARALWISLHQLGAIGDPSERALEAFAKRQLGVDRLQWADQRHSDGLIEALKDIANRHGWDQCVPSRLKTDARVRLLKERLVAAIGAKLATAGTPPTLSGDPSAWTEQQLDAATRDLAQRLRLVSAAR